MSSNRASPIEESAPYSPVGSPLEAAGDVRPTSRQARAASLAEAVFSPPLQVYTGNLRSVNVDMDEVIAAMTDSVANMHLALELDAPAFREFVEDEAREHGSRARKLRWRALASVAHSFPCGWLRIVGADRAMSVPGLHDLAADLQLLKLSALRVSVPLLARSAVLRNALGRHKPPPRRMRPLPSQHQSPSRTVVLSPVTGDLRTLLLSVR